MVKLNPVVAGNGVPLLRRDFDPRRLILREARPLPSGVVLLHYATDRTAADR